MTVRLSLGTAVVAGLARARLEAAPTTAYLLVGERCPGQCAFCPQARTSHSRPGLLSRVVWPAYAMDATVRAVAGACGTGRFARVCLQTVQGAEGRQQGIDLLGRLRRAGVGPVSVSAAPVGPGPADAWFEAGAERVGLPLDAACEHIFRSVKGPHWHQALAAVEKAAHAYPGRISTHLIVGLGETEEEAARLLLHLAGLGVTVALFAFTPVRGTPMSHHHPPPLDRFRRLQALRFLLDAGLGPRPTFERGRMVGFGLDPGLVAARLADGAAFCTSGCPGCNRPFYNERPGQVPYSYPVPLQPAEARAGARQALSGEVAP